MKIMTTLVFLFLAVAAMATEWKIEKRSSAENPYGPFVLVVSEGSDTALIETDKGNPYYGFCLIPGSGQGSVAAGEVALEKTSVFPGSSKTKSISLFSYENGKKMGENFLFEFAFSLSVSNSFNNGSASGSSLTKREAGLVFFSRKISVVYGNFLFVSKGGSAMGADSTKEEYNFLEFYYSGKMETLKIGSDSVASVSSINEGVEVLLSSGKKIAKITGEAKIKGGKNPPIRPPAFKKIPKGAYNALGQKINFTKYMPQGVYFVGMGHLILNLK